MNPPLPKRQNPGPPNRRTDVRREPPPPLDHPMPDSTGSMVALAGLAVTALLATGEQSSTLARNAAIGTLLSILVSAAFDLRLGGLRNLIRADLMAILSFFFLTLFEFLFPQPNFDSMTSARSAHGGVLCIMLGFAGLFLGRHLYHPRQQPFSHTLTREIPTAWIITIFWMCFVVGYAHMAIAVDFKLYDIYLWWLEARFSQPWQRGRLGDWKALVVELGLFIYLIPPLGGIILARRNRYGSMALFSVIVGLLITIFYGFTSGTRYIFAAYLVTFLIGYAFALPFAQRKELVLLYLGSALLMVGVSHVMLQFRGIGLRAYFESDYVPPPSAEEKTYFVDYNLQNISQVVDFFPKKADFLGWEIPYQALIRPIPRAVWSGKPEGLSKSIEDVLGVEGFTVSATFVGEAYMSGGYWAVAIIALGFGLISGWWSHLASTKNSELGILIYASAFFATVISMRSLFVFTTALLPTVAALIIGTYAVRMLTAQAQRLLALTLIRTRAQKRLNLPPRPVPNRPPDRPAR